MNARILTALGHLWESDVVTRLEQVRGAEVTRRCVDLEDLLAAAAAGLGDVALVSADVRGVDRDALAQLTTHGVRTVGVVPPGDDQAEVRLRQLGLTVVIPAESDATALAEALDPQDAARALDAWVSSAGLSELDALMGGVAEPPAGSVPTPAAEVVDPLDVSGEGRSGRILTVWGPAGAPGRTTLCVNLAAELADAGAEVLLVDADTYGASVAQALALLDEAPGVAAAARASENGTLDCPALARLAPEVTPGLRVLTGLPRPDRWTELRPAALEHVLAVARGLVDVVVVDCAPYLEEDEDLVYDTLAPRRNGATVTAIEAADEVIAAGAADPVGLQRLVRGLQELAAAGIRNPRVVITKLRSTAVGPSPRQRVVEALERFVDTGPIDVLPWDPVALDNAMLVGRALVEVEPGSPLRLAIRELAAQWSQEPGGPRAELSSRRRMTTRLIRRSSATMNA